MKKTLILVTTYLVFLSCANASTTSKYAFEASNEGSDTLTIIGVIVECSAVPNARVHLYPNSLPGSIHHLGIMGFGIDYRDCLAPSDPRQVEMVFDKRIDEKDLRVFVIVKNRQGKKYLLPCANRCREL